MKTTARELSKNEAEFDNLDSTIAVTTNEILITGSLQRIADALEKQNNYLEKLLPAMAIIIILILVIIFNIS